MAWQEKTKVLGEIYKKDRPTTQVQECQSDF
jgi:hypothetical protein